MNIASHEWLLTVLRWSNGGDVILLRAILVSSQSYLAVLSVKNALDPARDWTISWGSFVTELFATAHWLAPLFAAVYAALYSRYSAQWSYLAGVYNRVKETEARGLPTDEAKVALTEWKAGFIEDAEDLHLAPKSMFRATIRSWATPEVEAQFKAFTDNGPQRWERLMREIG